MGYFSPGYAFISGVEISPCNWKLESMVEQMERWDGVSTQVGRKFLTPGCSELVFVEVRKLVLRRMVSRSIFGHFLKFSTVLNYACFTKNVSAKFCLLILFHSLFDSKTWWKAEVYSR